MARPVDPRSWRPKYVQIADDLRTRVHTGEYQAGGYLPSEADLAHMYEVSPLTVRRALAILESERLIIREQGVRAQIRQAGERETMRLQPGDRFLVRPATLEERRRLNLAEREPVAEVTRPDGETVVVPAYEVEFQVVDQDSDGSASSAG